MPAPESSWPIFGQEVPDAAWRPGAAELSDSRLARFVRAAGFSDLTDLQARAAADPAWFWGAAADDLALPWQRRPREILDATRGPAWTRWWTGGAFNHAAAAIDPRADRDTDGEALLWEGDDGDLRRFTARELRDEVDRAAAMLTREGIGPGDRVGILLPMLPETVVAVLALGLLRAIFTPIFSGYGPAAIASRLRDCEASVLITADGFLRRGAVVPLKAAADEAVAAAPSVRRVLVVRRLGDRAPATAWNQDLDRWWGEALAATADVPAPPERVDTDPET
ncbi:MAG TPA: AMP-binding protein, partial [Candidatus Limnocylindrales bacterium]|nr:AMP-binding protein [Candidatus Limnocylindrales bacterium]